MTMIIERQGILDTIQDNGRFGFAKWGVNTSGAMDKVASCLANALVGNRMDESVIEMHFPCSEIRFSEDALIAISGAEFSPRINDSPIPNFKPIVVSKGSTLSFKRRTSGQRAYLAVNGSIACDKWLGSSSTNLKIRAGGYHGRNLTKGDSVGVSPSALRFKAEEQVRILPWSVNVQPFYERPERIRFIHGHEWSLLDTTSQKVFVESEFAISPASDRMGCHLVNEPMTFRKKPELLSSGVSYGTIQGLPNGKLIILMADHQTTGGYPRLGHVISGDLPKLSQRIPGETITFEETTTEDAEKILISLEEQLQMMHRSCYRKLQEYYAEH
jgi:antagonist of KipI